MHRQDQNRANMAKKRTLESPSETMHRQDQNRANMAKKRALESPSETVRSQEQNRANMQKKNGCLYVHTQLVSLATYTYRTTLPLKQGSQLHVGMS